MSWVVLSGERLVCTFADGDEQITALDDVSLQVVRGGLTLVVGPSGSGKTTLLTLLGLLRPPTSGLDDDTARDVLAQLTAERARGAALLLVSHDAGRFDDVTALVRLRDGRRVGTETA